MRTMILRFILIFLVSFVWVVNSNAKNTHQAESVFNLSWGQSVKSVRETLVQWAPNARSLKFTGTDQKTYDGVQAELKFGPVLYTIICGFNKYGLSRIVLHYIPPDPKNSEEPCMSVFITLADFLDKVPGYKLVDKKLYANGAGSRTYETKNSNALLLFHKVKGVYEDSYIVTLEWIPNDRVTKLLASPVKGKKREASSKYQVELAAIGAFLEELRR